MCWTKQQEEIWLKKMLQQGWRFQRWIILKVWPNNLHKNTQCNNIHVSFRTKKTCCHTMFAMAFCVREFSDWTEITVHLGYEQSFIDIVTHQSFDHQTPCWVGWAPVGADYNNRWAQVFAVTTRIISSSVVVFLPVSSVQKVCAKSSNWIPWNTKDRVGHKKYLKLAQMSPSFGRFTHKNGGKGQPPQIGGH